MAIIADVLMYRNSFYHREYLHVYLEVLANVAVDTQYKMCIATSAQLDKQYHFFGESSNLWPSSMPKHLDTRTNFAQIYLMHPPNQ
jgi:hypothetical protein